MNRIEMVSNGLVTITEACRFLSIGKSKLYELMQSEDLPYVRIGGVRRLPRRALAEWVAERLVARSKPQLH